MGLVTQLLGFKTTEMAKVSAKGAEQMSLKTTPGEIRISGEELELAYIKDPICFNSVNKSVQMIMAAGYEFRGEEKDTSYWLKFFNSIGQVGEDTTLDELLEGIYRCEIIYGNAYVELVFNQNGDRIVDLFLIDSKKMDYAKTADNKIVLDEYGKPIGYILSLPCDYSVGNRGDEIPEAYRNKISKNDNQIFLLAYRICHFKLYTYGDRFYGIGLIEPAYKSIIRKMLIEEAQTNSIYARGTYPVIAYVGDEMHEPSPQDIQAVLDNLVQLKHNRYMAFQYWTKIEPLEVKQSDIVLTTLEHLSMNETASLGMPMAFASGAGEKTNRATLNNQQQFLEYTLKDIVTKTVSTFKKYILNRIALYNKIKVIPEFKWKDIGAEEINDKANRLNAYVKNGILSPQDITDYVKLLEGLV